MNKKTIAYILIGGGVLAAAWYLYTRSKNKAAAGALGAGQPDLRGSWAAEDDALYLKFRNQFTADLHWLDPLVQQLYESGVPHAPSDAIKGVSTKSGSFARVIYNTAPNPSGTFPPVHWGGNSPSLWPPETIYKLDSDFNKLKVKYSAL